MLLNYHPDIGGASPAPPKSPAAPASDDAPTAPTAAPAAAPAQEQTTLLHNEEESFALAPVDASSLRPGMVRTKRKRKIIVDEVKAIAGEEMKAQVCVCIKRSFSVHWSPLMWSTDIRFLGI